jgi:hypothetical protein
VQGVVVAARERGHGGAHALVEEHAEREDDADGDALVQSGAKLRVAMKVTMEMAPSYHLACQA